MRDWRRRGWGRRGRSGSRGDEGGGDGVVDLLGAAAGVEAAVVEGAALRGVIVVVEFGGWRGV